MIKKVLCVFILLIAAPAWGEWSPPDNTWPDKRGSKSMWRENAAFNYTIPTYTQGASVSSGATAGQIQSCLDGLSSGEYCYMGAGTYNIGSTTLEIKSNTGLYGAGSDSVTVTYTGNYDAVEAASGSDSGSWINCNTVTKGDSTVTIASGASGWSNGDIIAISENGEDDTITNQSGGDNCGGNCGWLGDDDGIHIVAQFVELSNKTSNGGDSYTFDITPSAYYTYDSSPQVKTFTWAKSIGIQDIKFKFTSSGQQKNGGLNMRNMAYSWIRRVEVEGARTAVNLEYSFAATINRNYFHESAAGYGSDSGYLIWIFHNSSDHFIYDNIIDKARYAINFEGGGTGCIIAYNYMINVRDTDWDTALHSGIGLHGAHPTMNLIEGNITHSINPDYTLGSNSHQMIFRNWITREYLHTWSPSISDNLVAAAVGEYALYSSWVGNILGYYGMSGAYQYTHNDDPECRSSGYDKIFAWGADGFMNGSSCASNTYNTSYLHHNYDYVGDEIKNLANATCADTNDPFECCTGNGTGTCPSADTDLPDSLIFNSKEEAITYGVITSGDNWPPLDVDAGGNDFASNEFNVVSGTAYYIPAYRRYHSISDPPADTTPTIQGITINGVTIQ